MQLTDYATSVSKPITIKLLKQQFPQCKTNEELINYITTLNSISLKNSNLTTIDGLDMFSDLDNADLSCNIIDSLPLIVLELLMNLKHLNLSNNRIRELPDLSRLNMTDLNISHNPIDFLNLDFLPKKLQKLSVSGLIVQKDAIAKKYPQIAFYDTPEFIGDKYNETSTLIKLEVEKHKQELLKQEKEVEQLKNKLTKPVPQSDVQLLPSSKKPSSAKVLLKQSSTLVSKQKETPKVLKKLPPKKQAQKQDNVAQSQIDTQNDITKSSNVQKQLNEKYQQVLVEMDNLKENAVRDHIDTVIRDSRERMIKQQEKWDGAVAGDKATIHELDGFNQQVEQLIQTDVDYGEEWEEDFEREIEEEMERMKQQQ